MNKQDCLQVDRYLPIRQPHTHTLTKYSETASTVSTHLQLLDSDPSRLLSFVPPKNQTSSSLSSLSLVNDIESVKQKVDRLKRQVERPRGPIEINPEKVVEALGVVNDFYSNCLDSNSSEVLAIGLKDGCYLYNGRVCQELFDPFFYSYSYTCLKFNLPGSILFAATSEGLVQVFDVNKSTRIRKLSNHSGRVGCIENVEDQLLTGSKDNSIVLSDLRLKNSKVLTILAHQQEVCGLSRNNNNSVASSDSSGKVNIFDIRQKDFFSSRRLFNSVAIKALQWCPWKSGLLAAGGGSKDPKIILWNTTEDQIKEKINGESQVTGLRWRNQERQLVTTHSLGKGVVWDMSGERSEKKSTLVGHKKRIVCLAEGSQGVWTLGADHTLRSWTLLSKKREAISSEESTADFRLM